MSELFVSLSDIRRWPACVSQPLAEAFVARAAGLESREAITLVRSVEGLLGYVSRLWLAAWRSVDAPSAALDAEVLGRIAGRPSLPDWLLTAEALRCAGVPAPIDGLAPVLLSPQRADFRTALQLRNQYAHAGYRMESGERAELWSALDGMTASLSALSLAAPLVCWPDGSWRRADLGFAPATAPDGVDGATVTVTSPSGRPLDLGPFVRLSGAPNDPRLVLGGGIDDLLGDTGTAAWRERASGYRRSWDGLVEFPAGTVTYVPSGILDRVLRAGSRRNSILVTRPGQGLEGIARAVAAARPNVSVYLARHGVARSGLVLARWVARRGASARGAALPETLAPEQLTALMHALREDPRACIDVVLAAPSCVTRDDSGLDLPRICHALGDAVRWVMVDYSTGNLGFSEIDAIRVPVDPAAGLDDREVSEFLAGVVESTPFARGVLSALQRTGEISRRELFAALWHRPFDELRIEAGLTALAPVLLSHGDAIRWYHPRIGSLIGVTS